MAVVKTYPFLETLLEAAGLAVPISTSVVHLYKQLNAPLTGSSVVGDFVECDFTGYASAAFTPAGSAYRVPGGLVELPGAKYTAELAAPGTVQNSVYGWYVTDVAGTNLLYAEEFSTPFNLGTPGDGFSFIPKVTLP